ncbi:MAG: hypothetical protein J5965_26095 [Aeriscardovia sp.]|nr:hypothetical protein [Aeriscardovia sp.]
MQYNIIKKIKLPCRVVDVQLRATRSNGAKFVVAKLGKYDTGEFLRSIIFFREAIYGQLVSEIQTKKRHTIERIVIRPHNNVYHILQWDDDDRGICTREHLDEVQRDNEGKPIPFNQIVIYANLDNKNLFTVDKVLDKEYIEVNSPIVQSYLNFNNQQYFLKQQEERRKRRESDYDQMMSDLYDAYEEKRYSDMSEEERVMSALENGNGELCGF